MHPLDTPVWSALTSGWAHLAQGDDRAWRLDPHYGPFAAARNAADADAIAALIPDDGEIWMVGRDIGAAPAGTRVLRTAMLAQMVMEGALIEGPAMSEWEPLNDADGAEMHALATMTKPGPFASLTHRFGGFIGVRDQGKLIAMAGTRMRVPGYAEISGVCTHPDHRGKGYAKALMRIVAQAMVAQGDIPFLHAYADHHGTIALYETLGFRVRGRLPMMVLARN